MKLGIDQKIIPRWVMYVVFNLIVIVGWVVQRDGYRSPKTANTVLVITLAVLNGGIVAGILSRREFRRGNQVGKASQDAGGHAPLQLRQPDGPGR